MIDYSILPTINAAFNSLCTLFLLMGFWAIKTGYPNFHRAMMIGALLCSVLFLISYLTYHAEIGSKPFTKTGWIRSVYFTILIIHTVLAAVIVPLVLRTVLLAFRKQFDRHKVWARWTWPLWMTVSVTGVVIYWMLYQ